MQKGSKVIGNVNYDFKHGVIVKVSKRTIDVKFLADDDVTTNVKTTDLYDG